MRCEHDKAIIVKRCSTHRWHFQKPHHFGVIALQIWLTMPDRRAITLLLVLSIVCAAQSFQLCSPLRVKELLRTEISSRSTSHPHMLFAADDTDSSTANATSSLYKLEAMKATELKSLLKQLGGKPGAKKKAELVIECHQLLVTSFNAAQREKNGKIEVDSNIDATGAVIQQRVYSPKQRREGRSTSNENFNANTNNSNRINSTQNNHNNNSKTKKKGPFKMKSELSSFGISDLSTPKVNFVNSDGSLDFDKMKDVSEETEALTNFKKNPHPYGPLRDTRFAEESVTADVDLTFLGTASCVPSTTRGVSCIALRAESDVWLFDCGESTQLQMQKSKVRPSKIKKIFLTHAHGDHSFGLPGVLCLIGQSTQEEREAQGYYQTDLSPGSGKGYGGVGPQAIDIYGPEGTRDLVRATIQLTYSRVVAPFRVHELKEVPYLHGKMMKWRPPLPNVRTRFDPYYGEQEGGLDIYPDEQGIYNLVESQPQGCSSNDDGPRSR